MRDTLTSVVAAALFMAAACLWGCSGGDNSQAPAVPRAKAFPRPYDYGRSYRTVDSLPLHLEANTNATVRLTPQGADIIYPRYRATIHVSSLTLPSDDPCAIARELDGRRQRIALNLGQARAEELTLPNDGAMEVSLVRAATAIPTPLQMVATDSRRHIVTATAFVDFMPSVSATDSLAPVIDALAADITHLAKTLRP